MIFDTIVKEVIGIEGGYSNHKSDSGGETMYGITEAVARREGYRGKMSELPYGVATQIYREKYWYKLQLDEISLLSQDIARELFDTGVNQGVGRAGEYLQIALNALNRQGRDYPDVRVDGDIGSATINALKAYLKFRGNTGEIVMLRALNCLQGAFYVTLSQTRPKDEDFLFGWLLTRVNI